MADPLLPRATGWVRLIVPTAVSVGLFAALLLNAHLSFGALTEAATINSLELLGVILALSLGAGYIVQRFLLPSGGAAAAHNPPGAPTQAGGQLRDRLAQNVMLIGTLGIAGTALALLIAIAVRDANLLPTTGLSIFTAVIPVFSTWVGTVLAFYFTNESFRQAAETAQGGLRGVEAEPITRPGTMVPYERVIRYEMTAADIGGLDPKVAAESLKLSKVAGLFTPPGVVRVVVFDDKQHPIYVLRDDAMPKPTPPATQLDPGLTLKDYLDLGANRTAAGNFSTSASTATVGDGRRMLELRKVTDLFVTQHGRIDEPTLGWVPDDNLKVSP